MLFTLCVEFLAKGVKQDNTIKGIEINNEEKKIIQHADDTTLLLKDKDSILPTVQTIERFSNVSGLFLNLDKKTREFGLGMIKIMKT